MFLLIEFPPCRRLPPLPGPAGQPPVQPRQPPRLPGTEYKVATGAKLLKYFLKYLPILLDKTYFKFRKSCYFTCGRPGEHHTEEEHQPGLPGRAGVPPEVPHLHTELVTRKRGLRQVSGDSPGQHGPPCQPRSGLH